MEPNILIRPMNQDDLEKAASMMVDAFRDKLLLMTDWSDEKIANLIIDANLFKATHFSGIYIATINGEIAGLMELIGDSVKTTEKSTRPSIIKIIRKYGFISLIQGLVLLLDHHKSNRDLYVDSLAVSPEYRGLGVGTALLKYGYQLAKSDNRIEKYTLMVIGRNTGALKLYKRFGFKIYRSYGNWFVEKLIGVKFVHHMSMDA